MSWTTRDALTVDVVDTLPQGAVRLLTEALGTARRGMGWVCWIRACHLAWQLRSVAEGDRRIVVARNDGDLVGVAVTQRFSARPCLFAVCHLTLLVLGVTVLVDVLMIVVPRAMVSGAFVVGVAAALLGALAVDGGKGIAGARAARRRAREIGRNRTWGRGLVAVAATARGLGVGRSMTQQLVGTLPVGDHWVPVALTSTAARIYEGLGGVPLAGAACDLLVRPDLGTDTARTPVATAPTMTPAAAPAQLSA